MPKPGWIIIHESGQKEFSPNKPTAVNGKSRIIKIQMTETLHSLITLMELLTALKDGFLKEAAAAASVHPNLTFGFSAKVEEQRWS